MNYFVGACERARTHATRKHADEINRANGNLTISWCKLATIRIILEIERHQLPSACFISYQRTKSIVNRCVALLRFNEVYSSKRIWRKLRRRWRRRWQRRWWGCFNDVNYCSAWMNKWTNVMVILWVLKKSWIDLNFTSVLFFEISIVMRLAALFWMPFEYGSTFNCIWNTLNELLFQMLRIGTTRKWMDFFKF